MISSIKAIIRAWLAPRAGLVCPGPLWREIVAELERRGEASHEAGAFLLGTVSSRGRKVSAVVYYDELDPTAYSSGVCILTAPSFAALWAICRERGLAVVADVHTHPDAGFQSWSDRTNPMIAREGHVALILPYFGRWPIDQARMGIYVYRGDHEWIDRSPSTQRGFFSTRSRS